MFPLRRPARQIVATLLLAALLIVPTLAIALHAWRIHQPGHVREHELAISRLLGLHISVANVEFPRPGERIYNEVVLRREQAAASPALLAELIRIPRLRVVEETAAVTLHADKIVITSPSPDALVDQLDALASRPWPLGVTRVSLLVDEAHWRSTRDDQARDFPVRDLAASIQVNPTDETISATYRWGATHDSPRCELVWNRSPHPEGVLTDILLQFDETPAPVALLEPWFSTESWFGTTATLDGLVRFQRVDRRPWNAHFEGTIHSLDLDHLLAAHFPDAQLSGRADLEVTRAEWGQLPRGQGLGWTEVQGRLDARDGAVSARFLDSLTADLRFRADDIPAQPVIPYSRLALAFILDSDGQLTIQGSLGPGHPRDAVLISTAATPTPLLLAPVAAASVRGLWKSLFPSDGDVLVPATAESQVLRHLPLPPAAATPLRAN